MVEIFAKGVGKNSTVKFEKCIELPVTMLKTNKGICKVIEVTYEIKVIASTPELHFDLNMHIDIPITICSVAFGERPTNNITCVPDICEYTEMPPYPISDAPPYATAPYPTNGGFTLASAPLENDLRKPINVQEVLLFLIEISICAAPSFYEAMKLSPNNSVNPSPRSSPITIGWDKRLRPEEAEA